MMVWTVGSLEKVRFSGDDQSQRLSTSMPNAATSARSTSRNLAADSVPRAKAYRQ
jgi:hypothetical protein